MLQNVCIINSNTKSKTLDLSSCRDENENASDPTKGFENKIVSQETWKNQEEELFTGYENSSPANIEEKGCEKKDRHISWNRHAYAEDESCVKENYVGSFKQLSYQQEKSFTKEKSEFSPKEKGIKKEECKAKPYTTGQLKQSDDRNYIYDVKDNEKRSCEQDVKQKAYKEVNRYAIEDGNMSKAEIEDSCEKNNDHMSWECEAYAEKESCVKENYVGSFKQLSNQQEKCFTKEKSEFAPNENGIKKKNGKPNHTQLVN
ncbi:unnamed protein product [Mytilus edulis]|uniref:Uncharacterized protein n=1 Tax=Mytilus edulis TaxID=6550 RepID=A0A8S3R443_MYTED|nr:unnamed protein product [Mytilus edulis]